MLKNKDEKLDGYEKLDAKEMKKLGITDLREIDDRIQALKLISIKTRMEIMYLFIVVPTVTLTILKMI